jgi:hypothetical protein
MSYCGVSVTVAMNREEAAVRGPLVDNTCLAPGYSGDLCDQRMLLAAPYGS